MARVKRGVTSHAKHKKVLEQAKGYRGRRKNTIKVARQAVEKALQYAYRDRRQRKRDFRALWIQRINAGAREHGLSYSQFVHGLRLAEIDLDRKVLADLAATEPEAFGAIVTQARNALNGEPVERRIQVEWQRAEEAPKAPAKPAEKKPKSKPESKKAAPEPQRKEDVEATDAAERRAEELNVDLESVEATGAEGQVIVEDVEEAAEGEGKVHATEAAERKAGELGVDLSTVEGTGKDGRITVGDVDKAAKAQTDDG